MASHSHLLLLIVSNHTLMCGGNTDDNHADTATFPTKHTYTYIYIKKVYFVQKADRQVPRHQMTGTSQP